MRRTCWGGGGRRKHAPEITSDGACSCRRGERAGEKGPLVRGEGEATGAKRRGVTWEAWRIVEGGTGGISWHLRATPEGVP